MFTYLIISFCLGMISILGLTSTGEVAKIAVQALEGVTMLSLVSYLGISAVDRAGILDRFGKAAPRQAPPQ